MFDDGIEEGIYTDDKEEDGQTEEAAKNIRLYTMTVKGVREDLYFRLWNLRKKLKVKTWAELLDRLTEGYDDETKEVYWI